MSINQWINALLLIFASGCLMLGLLSMNLFLAAVNFALLVITLVNLQLDALNARGPQ